MLCGVFVEENKLDSNLHMSTVTRYFRLHLTSDTFACTIFSFIRMFSQAEYSYFSADFRLKIFLYYSNITLFFIRIYFIRISRLKFAKFYEYFKNKAEAEILKRIDIILC